MHTSKACVAALLALLAVGAPNAEGQKPSWQDRLKKKVSKVLADSSEAAPTVGASRSGETKDVTAGPRNRDPQVTGVWKGVLLASWANPNRYDWRLEVTQRGNSISGTSRMDVPGDPLRFTVFSIDGTIEDGVIKMREVRMLRSGSQVPSCISGISGTFIVATDQTMRGDWGTGCANGGMRGTLHLNQISTVSPELADGGANSSPTAEPPSSATMVMKPDVTGIWSGTFTQPNGNPNRYTWRLDLTQRNGAITGTARIEAPDNPLRYATMTVEGNVDEGIITLVDKQVLKYGNEPNWCKKRSVLLLKTDSTLSGDWDNCSGGGKVYLKSAK